MEKVLVSLKANERHERNHQVPHPLDLLRRSFSFTGKLREENMEILRCVLGNVFIWKRGEFSFKGEFICYFLSRDMSAFILPPPNDQNNVPE